MRHTLVASLILAGALLVCAATAGAEEWQKVPDDSPGTRVKLGRLSVMLPGGAQWFPHEEARRIDLHLSLYRTGTVALRDETAPASLDAAVRIWTKLGGTLLASGTGDGGLHHVVVTHEIQVPMEIPENGRQKSRLETITVVYAVRPVGGGTLAECEFRLEYEATSLDDEGVQQALAICTSMSTAVPR